DARLIEKAEAPCALVEVPTTVAPAPARAIAMALPIPREAPVTSAVCFSSMRYSFSAGLGGRQCSLDGSGIFQRHELESGSLLDSAIQCRQHFPGPALDHLTDVRLGNCPDGCPPLHRA